MNRKASLSALGIFLLILGFAFAAEEEQKAETRGQGRGRVQRPSREQAAPAAPAAAPEQTGESRMPERPGLRRGPVTPTDRTEAYNRVLAQRQQTHVEGIDELEAIKKIAQEENAVQTVAAIDALIAKKKAAFQEQQVELEKQRQQFRQRLEERQNSRQQVPARPQTRRPEPPRPQAPAEQPAQPEAQP